MANAPAGLPKKILCIAATIVSLFVYALPAPGQSPGTGAVQGTVKDSSGAIIPNVMVTLTADDGQTQAVKPIREADSSCGTCLPERTPFL